jgi:carboxypeptidase family protein
MMVLILSLALLFGAAAAPSTGVQIKDPNAQVRGRVLEQSTNAPISGARVVFAFRGRSRLQTVTDDDGRYSFAELEPGPYRLAVQKAGYVPLDAATLPTYWVVAGQTLDIATVSLQKSGAIAGRILDPSGEPLVDVNVRAMKPGATAVANAAASHTNDLGEFRVFGLLPGEYIIAASVQSAGLDTVLASPALVLSTYYPGTADAAAAQTLTVGAGQTVAGIEFRVLTAGTFKVSGVVVDDRGMPIAGASVRLAGDSRVSGGIAAGVIGGTRSTATGKFSINNVRSGAYYATATAPPSDPVEVIVNDADVDSVTIVIHSR